MTARETVLLVSVVSGVALAGGVIEFAAAVAAPLSVASALGALRLGALAWKWLAAPTNPRGWDHV